MSEMINLFVSSIMQALGWTLLHFIWQGALIAALLALALACLRDRAAQSRYLAACAAMLLLAIAPAATFWALSDSTRTDKGLAAAITVTSVMESPAPAIDPPEPRRQQTTSASYFGFNRPLADQNLERLFPWLISLWLFGVLFSGLRLLGGWWAAQRLKNNGVARASGGWQGVVDYLSTRLGVARSVRLLTSTLVQVPTVIGWLRPVILVPPSAVLGLPPSHLQAILIHELAHLRRYDYLVNLLQSVVETVLFYHPAVWWVSRQIRREREYCCDDIAVAVCGDRLAYARALTEMEGLRAAGQWAMAANGGDLMSRIRRLVSGPALVPKRALSLPIVVGLVTAGMILFLIPGSPSAGVNERGAATASSAQGGLPGRDIGIAEPVNVRLTTIGSPPVGQDERADEREETSTPAAVASAAVVGKIDIPENKQQEGQASIEGLLKALKSPDWQVRKAAVEEMGLLSDARLLNALIEALRDEHIQVREQAARAMGKRGDSSALAPLAEGLKDPDWEVREAAADAMGQLGDIRVVALLLDSLNDRDWRVREQVARALGIRGNGQAVEPLIAALKDEDGQVREAAAKSLGRIGDARAINPLTLALQDKDEQVRINAAEALSLLGR